MNVFQSVVLWVIFVVVVSFLMVGCTGYDYKLDTINHKVNSYGYLSDYEHGEHGIKLMSPTQPGDCEDHAYTKCRMIKEQYPEIETYFLSRKAGAGGVAHAALAANGFVLVTGFVWEMVFNPVNSSRRSGCLYLLCYDNKKEDDNEHYRTYASEGKRRNKSGKNWPTS